MLRPAFLATLILAAPATAQVAPSDSLAESVQLVAPPPSQPPLDDLAQARAAAARGDAPEALSRYLRLLAGHPDDVVALRGAGEAALAVGDLTAASGFFGRAEARAPNDGAIKAGIGATLVRQGDARGALRSFRAAAQLGVPEARFAADRGLAFDLRGEPRRAQADYQLALVQHPGDAEILKRFALSQALAGEGTAALATLDPLLRRQDMAAWRTRMFARAVAGDVAGATADAGLILNAQQAATIAPYLARLAALKPADKAAAVFLGRMPSVRTSVAGAAPPSPARMPAPPPAALAETPPPSDGKAVAVAPSLFDLPPAQPAPAQRPLSRREQRAEARRQAIEAKKAAVAQTERRNPTRYWAQIAGGANRRDLPRAWAALKAKWSSQLAGRSPAMMHYRYTNRLLIGPFASAAAAQDWVDARRGEGMASFMVTTPPGSSVETLGGAEVGAADVPAKGRHGKAAKSRHGKASAPTHAHGKSSHRRHR